MDENGANGKKHTAEEKSELPDRSRLSRSAGLQLRVFEFVGKCPEEGGHVSGADKNHHHRVVAFTAESRGREREEALRRGRKSTSRLQSNTCQACRFSNIDQDLYLLQLTVRLAARQPALSHVYILEFWTLNTHSELSRIWLRPSDALISVLVESLQFLDPGSLDETMEPGRISWLLYRFFFFFLL